jgi:hypothetical protein
MVGPFAMNQSFAGSVDSSHLIYLEVFAVSRFGSFPDVCIFHSVTALENSMTAIAIVGSQRGFIIAADGRKRLFDEDRASADTAELEKETDQTRKIFDVAGDNWKFAYAIRGFCEDTLGFDLIETIKRETRVISSLEFYDSFKLMESLGAGISRAMNAARQAGTIENFPEQCKVENGGPWFIAEVFFAGYFNGYSRLIIVTFVHYNQVSGFRLISNPPLPILVGSDKVRAAMYNLDGSLVPMSPFGKLAKSLPQRPTLREGEEYAKGYIEACSSPLARQIDPKNCEGIGGHIHIAEITPRGFNWRVPPLP